MKNKIGTTLKHVILKLECALESPGGLVKTQIARPASRIPVAVGLGWGLRISQVTLMLWV